MSKLTRLGPFPFSMGVGTGWYVADPGSGPKWKLRLNFTVLLPKVSPGGGAR